MRDQLGVEGGKLLVELLRNFRKQKQVRILPLFCNPQKIDHPVQIDPQPQCVDESKLKPAPMVRLEDAHFSPITSTAEEASRCWRAIGHQVRFPEDNRGPRFSMPSYSAQ